MVKQGPYMLKEPVWERCEHFNNTLDKRKIYGFAI